MKTRKVDRSNSQSKARQIRNILNCQLLHCLLVTINEVASSQAGPGNPALSAADRRCRESIELSGSALAAEGADVTVVTSQMPG